MLKSEKFYKYIFIVVLICVNPPVLTIINNLAKNYPLLWGYPTVWLWLQLWYGIAIVAFLLAAFLVPEWNKEKYKAGDIQ